MLGISRVGFWVSGGFLTVSVCEAIYPRSVRVPWAGRLWGGQNIPMHSFCAWLAIKNSSGTQDRLGI